MICSHRRIGVASHQSCSTPISHRSGTVPPLSIPARTFRLIPAKSYDGKITQAIPPPPPYHASVRSAIHHNEINQITTQIQQSCSTNVFNVSASSSSTVTTNINAINATNSAVYVDQNPIKQLTSSEKDDDAPDQTHMDEIITADNYENHNDNSNISGSSSSNSNTTSNNASATTPRMELDNNELDHENDTPSGKSIKFHEHSKQRNKSHRDTTPVTSDPIPCDTSSSSKEMRRAFKQEAVDVSALDCDNVHDKRTRGLKVLSNVQVSPNAILNVSLNSTNNETMPLNNMIILSSIPSTSSGATSQSALSTQLAKSQSLLKNLKDTRTTLDTRKSKHTKVNVEVSFIHAARFDLKNFEFL